MVIAGAVRGYVAELMLQTGCRWALEADERRARLTDLLRTENVGSGAGCCP